MRRVSGPYVFPISSREIRYGIVSLRDDHFIDEIIDSGGTPKEISSLEYFNGIILPGLICVDISNSYSNKPDPSQLRLLFERGVNVLFRPEKHIMEQTAMFSAGVFILDKKSVTDFTAKTWKFLAEVNKLQEFSHLLSLKCEKESEPWFLIQNHTLLSNEPSELFSFFQKNVSRIIFSWNGDPIKFALFLEFFLQHNSGLQFNEVLSAVTINPSVFLGMNDYFGKLKEGMAPGILLLEGVDFRNMSVLRGKTRLKRLA